MACPLAIADAVDAPAFNTVASEVAARNNIAIGFIQSDAAESKMVAASIHRR
jgi:hypothetical protein